jgi:hypothetical protein
VPVYESLSKFPATLRTINRIVVGLPIFTLATAVMPYIAFTTLALHYFLYFKVFTVLKSEFIRPGH